MECPSIQQQKELEGKFLYWIASVLQQVMSYACLHIIIFVSKTLSNSGYPYMQNYLQLNYYINAIHSLQLYFYKHLMCKGREVFAFIYQNNIIDPLNAFFNQYLVYFSLGVTKAILILNNTFTQQRIIEFRPYRKFRFITNYL